MTTPQEKSKLAELTPAERAMAQAYPDKKTAAAAEEEGEWEEWDEDDEDEDDDGPMTLYTDFIDDGGFDGRGRSAQSLMKSFGGGASTSGGAANANAGGGGATHSAAKTDALTSQSNRVHMGDFRSSNVGGSVNSSIKETEKKLDKDRIRTKDKADRATAEQVLDPRTRLMLSKMLNNAVLSTIHGCISTGKEANVYYATSTEGERAVKIYKTSILVFKDRDRYVSGEYRFRHGYSKSNPRKMVRVWAEKEMRNLKRLYSVGIPCPLPVALKNHILIMSLIGEEGRAAPRLRNAELNQAQMRECYTQIVIIMRRMYHECHLIHADLSEYNILYYQDQPYIIDVSQSVEHDHPHSMDFLKKDVENMTRFFRSGGVAVMTMQELFEFVMDDTITDVDAWLGRMQDTISQRPAGFEEENQVAEGVFLGAPVIRRLDDIIDHEREQKKLLNKTDGFHQALAQMTVQTNKPDADEKVPAPDVKKPTSSSSKPSSKAVSAPTVVATGRDLAASSLFAGLLLPQAQDQEFTTNAEPGYISGEDDEEEEDDAADVAPAAAAAAGKKPSQTSVKASAKPVSAPTVVATGRDLAASQLFAGLLLPQMKDQEFTTNAEPGYISGEDDEEEEEDDLPVNLNHTEAGGRRVMTHVRRGVQFDVSDSDDDFEDDDDADDSDDSGSNSNSDGEEESAVWVERPVQSAEEARLARKAQKKEAKAMQAEKRKTKMKKKDKKAKINKGKK